MSSFKVTSDIYICPCLLPLIINLEDNNVYNIGKQFNLFMNSHNITDIGPQT